MLSSLMNELDPHLEGPPGGPLDGGLDVDGLAMLDGLAVEVDGLAMPERPTGLGSLEPIPARERVERPEAGRSPRSWRSPRSDSATEPRDSERRKLEVEEEGAPTPVMLF